MTIRRWPILRYCRRNGIRRGSCASGRARAQTIPKPPGRGFVTNTANTSACAGVGGSAIGEVYVSVYRPKINATDTATFLSFIHERGALALQNTSEASNTTK